MPFLRDSAMRGSSTVERLGLLKGGSVCLREGLPRSTNADVLMLDALVKAGNSEVTATRWSSGQGGDVMR
jgi:hypothetical protein